ncbi:MAG: hypothetical protein VCC04_12995, partial [Myxococcota bacterium]
MSGRRVSAQIGLPGRSRLPRRRAAGWVVAAAAVLLTATSAGADCVPDAATVQEGDTVICTGPNDPYVVPAEINQVTVDIQEGASFPVGGSGVQVNDESQVTNSGEILIDFIGGIGISGGNGLFGDTAVYENTASGTIIVNSPDSWGIFAGDFSEALVQGQIRVNGDGSVGVQLGILSQVRLEEGAQLDVTGASGVGALCAGSGCEFYNGEGSNLVVSGEDSVGFVGGASNQFFNDGHVEISGLGATGFLLIEEGGGGTFENHETGTLVLSEDETVGAFGEGEGSTLSNEGSISSTGDFSGVKALEAGLRGQISNAGAIEMDGDEATALLVGDGEENLSATNRSQATVEE